MLVVAFSKPKSFDHYLEDELIYDLNFKDDNNKTIKNLFFRIYQVTFGQEAQLI